jgi:pyruvate dehydrogenase E2 component (dihydrolipoamide acetyltransferase)
MVSTVGRLLGDFPRLNVTHGEDGPIAIEDTGIGVAVDTPAGLLVPVLPAAATRSLREVAEWLGGAADRARRLRLKPDDLSPKSMVVSNLGPLGIDGFHAIIDPSDPMILAVGRTVERVVAAAGRLVIVPMANFSLSIDHRVIDGADGARFLAALRDRIESIDATGGAS